MDNGQVSGLLAHVFTVYQGSSGSAAAIVYLHCCMCECIHPFKCFVPENDAPFFLLVILMVLRDKLWFCILLNAFGDFFNIKVTIVFK